jgi:hypothetical protein
MSKVPARLRAVRARVVSFAEADDDRLGDCADADEAKVSIRGHVGWADWQKVEPIGGR